MLVYMDSLFRAVLGNQINHLAPALQLHYDIPLGCTVIVTGKMDMWNRFGALRLLTPFAPKNQQSVDVCVKNRTLQLKGDTLPSFEWQREFRYVCGTQYSYTLSKATTSVSGNNATCSIMDLYNYPPSMGITLDVQVSDDGNMLTQVTTGLPQYWIQSGQFVRLPGLFNMSISAVERAVGPTTIHTEVVVSHKVWGRCFGYTGELELHRRFV